MGKGVWVALLILILLVPCSEGCLEQERDALLHLKSTFTDDADSVDDWVNGTDCCQWEGVYCNTITRRVENLTLFAVWNDGSDADHWYLNFSDFLVFEHLIDLHLGENNIIGCVEPEGSKNLTLRLNNMEVLDLSGNQLNDSSLLSCFSWFSHSSLKSLDLGHNYLTAKSIHGLSTTLNNLVVLNLRGNNFNDSHITSSLRWKNVTSRLSNVEVLDLSENQLNDSSLLSCLSWFSPSSLKSLYLHDNYLTAKSIEGLSSTLINLEFLDLSHNNFNDSDITSSFDNERSLWQTSLEILYLDGNKFSNKILSSFRGLQHLNSLSISDNQLEGSIDISGLTTLRKLKMLDVSNNNITDFVVHQGTKCLISVKELLLINLTVDGSKLQKSLRAFPSIRMLDMSNNDFKGRRVIASDFGELHNLEELRLDHSSNIGNEFFQSIGALTSLKAFSMSYSAINGTLPTGGWSKLNKLEELDLSENEFEGLLPSSFCNMTSLRKLYLSRNNFIGNLASNLASLTSLEGLQFLGNQFEIPASFSFFANHSNLKFLIGSGQLLPDPYPHSQTWVPKFQLNEFALYSTTVANSLPLPRFLFYQYNLTNIFLKDWNVNLDFPNWLLENNTQLTDFTLTNCSIIGNFQLPSHPNPNIRRIDTSGNAIIGHLPSSNYTSIFPNLEALVLSSNAIHGSLPCDISQMKSLDMLDLSNNYLSGSIPMEFFKLGNLGFLDLSNNNLSSSIPSFSNSVTLEFIDLSNNRLSGLDTRMFNESSNVIKILDLSHNDISSGIQDLICNLNSATLQALLLKGNHFIGQIPKQLCQFTYLRIIDFSENNIFGHVPNCLGSIQFKNESGIGYFHLFGGIFYFQQQVAFTKKNRFDTYSGDILEYSFVMDLSQNMLNGNIPPKLGNLTSIQSINLSHNHLVGPIPTSFSHLKFIESLDLSFNKLSGKIPPQLIELTSLEVFSVAHNNLSGSTPDTKNQFMTFDESSYEDNPFLCGPPLEKSCTSDIGQPNGPTPKEDNDNGFLDMEVFYVSFVVSYTSALLAFAVVLYINPHWRKSWFYFIEVFITNCYYFVLDNSCILMKGALRLVKVLAATVRKVK